MWFLMNNIDSHSIECAIYNVCKHRVLRLRSTDWKSSLSEAEYYKKIIKKCRLWHVETAFYSPGTIIIVSADFSETGITGILHHCVFFICCKNKSSKCQSAVKGIT